MKLPKKFLHMVTGKVRVSPLKMIRRGRRWRIRFLIKFRKIACRIEERNHATSKTSEREASEWKRRSLDRKVYQVTFTMIYIYFLSIHKWMEFRRKWIIICLVHYKIILLPPKNKRGSIPALKLIKMLLPPTNYGKSSLPPIFKKSIEATLPL